MCLRINADSPSADLCLAQANDGGESRSPETLRLKCRCPSARFCRVGAPVGAGFGGCVSCALGGYVAAAAADRAKGAYFEFQDRQQGAEWGRFVYDHYGVTAPSRR